MGPQSASLADPAFWTSGTGLAIVNVVVLLLCCIVALLVFMAKRSGNNNSVRANANSIVSSSMQHHIGVGSDHQRRVGNKQLCTKRVWTRRALERVAEEPHPIDKLLHDAKELRWHAVNATTNRCARRLKD